MVFFGADNQIEARKYVKMLSLRDSLQQAQKQVGVASKMLVHASTKDIEVDVMCSDIIANLNTITTAIAGIEAIMFGKIETGGSKIIFGNDGKNKKV